MNPLLSPSQNFNQVRDGRRSTLFYYDIDLSIARTRNGSGANSAIALNVAGDSFYADKNPAFAGTATVVFQDTNRDPAGAPVFVEPGFIASVPFTQLLFINDAQAGKRLRFHYGTDIDFQPGASSSVTVNGIVDINDASADNVENRLTWGGSQYSLAAAGQKSAAMLWNAAGNPRNLLVRGLTFSCFGGSSRILIGKMNSTANMSASTGGTSRNLSFGNASYAQIFQTVAVAPAAFVGSPFEDHLIAALDPVIRDYDKSPILVTPGTGLLILTNTVNLELSASFVWDEVVP